ncbi:GNAT family N-acetyltransferase [Paenibacillus sp. sgz500958]|uniref:GNAT family N-acetyltransferase n=1 Tax=Paenibacillus sp. sgz500958 TaxID=3242475 RepID=UPI0036D2E94E
MGLFTKIEFTDKQGRNITIRAATGEDADQVLAYNTSIIKNEPYLLTTAEEFNLTAEDERSWIEKVQREPDNLVLIAEHQGEVVGFLDLQCGHRRRIAHTGTISISIGREYRGSGAAKVLLLELIRWAKANRRIEKIILYVFSSNEPAIGLYRSVGFVQESLQQKQIKLENGEYLDLIGMGLFLKPEEEKNND